MTNEEKAKQILKLFDESMDSDDRHLLIKLYEVCILNKSIKDEPDVNLLQFETSFNIIESKIINKVFQQQHNFTYVDDNDYKKQKHIKVNTKDIEKIKNNIILSLLYSSEKESSILNNTLDEPKILQYYIMLDDCIKNYDDDNIVLKKQAIKLLTEIEILLKLPITFPSQIINCVDDLIEENIKDKKGGVTLGR